MSDATPTRDDHQRFCSVEGWTLVLNARGKPVRHHETYELNLPDGRVLRTRVSRPVDRTAYGPAMFRHILNEQLHVTEDVFWSCVRDRKPPGREQPTGFDLERSLPASLVHQLLHELHLPEAEVASMTRDQAIARMQKHWSQPPS